MTQSESGELLSVLKPSHCAVVVVDLVESVRLMQAHEADVIQRWRQFVSRVRTEILPPTEGTMVKSLGDGLLLRFPSARQAAAATVGMHRALIPLNLGHATAECMFLRIGGHVADVVVDDLDMYGSGVNLAARLGTLAGPGETVVSEEFRKGLVDGLDPEVQDLGSCVLKNLSEPVRAFKLGHPESPVAMPAFDTFWRERPAVAVLPFRCLPGEGEAALLGEIMADQLIHELAHMGAWRVISRLSMVAYRDREVDLEEVRRRLGVTWVITGRCQVTAGRVRLTAELADATNGTVIWSGHVDGTPQDVLLSENSLGSQCAQRIVGATLQHELLQSQCTPLPRLSSHTLLFAAVSLMHRMSRSDFMRGQALLDQLLERHPRSPEPHAWYAKWHVMRVVQGWSDQPELDSRAGRTCALRALEERSNHALGLAVDGLVLGLLESDLDRSRQRYEAAIAANPNESLAWLFLSALQAYQDQGEAAARSAERALSLSPLDPVRYFYDSFAAHALLAAGRTTEAVQFAQRSLRLNGSHLPTFRTLAIAQVMSDDAAGAARTVQQLLLLAPDYSVGRFLRAYPGRESALASRSAQALASAGLPAG